MAVVVIADSRGRDLQKLMNKEEPNYEIYVEAMGGAGSELAAIRAIPTIVRRKPTLVILMTGICDLTWRDKHSKVTKLRYREEEECVMGVMSGIESAHEVLGAMGQHKISVATLTGIDLADYNYPARRKMDEGEYANYCKNGKNEHKDQGKLNSAVIEINRRITELNKKNGVQTTWMSTIIHSYYRNVHHNKYKKLRDGCHPDEGTKVKWAKQLLKSIKHILKIGEKNKQKE